MARLYANENFPFPVVEALRQLGHEVITVSETGKADQSWPDEAVLEFATQDDRALLTLNRKHFIRLHNLGLDHAGIITCTVDIEFANLARRIDTKIRSTLDMKNQLLRINRPSSQSSPSQS